MKCLVGLLAACAALAIPASASAAATHVHACGTVSATPSATVARDVTITGRSEACAGVSQVVAVFNTGSGVFGFGGSKAGGVADPVVVSHNFGVLAPRQYVAYALAFEHAAAGFSGSLPVNCAYSDQTAVHHDAECWGLTPYIPTGER